MVGIETTGPVMPVAMTMPTLRRGSRGPVVAAWQRFLFARGHVLAPTGVFDLDTEITTKRWQSESGIGSDGVVGSVESWPAAIRQHFSVEDSMTIESPPNGGGEHSYPIIHSAHYTRANRHGVKWIVIHTMENPEKPDSAEAVASWLSSPKSPKVSAHYYVDNDSVVQGVAEVDVAWAAPGANRYGIHIEHAGRARQTAEDWDDAYSAAMLRRSARLVGGICRRWSIHPVRVTAEDMRRGVRGICGHDTVRDAFGKTTHYDPGEGFPWDRYISLVQGAMS